MNGNDQSEFAKRIREHASRPKPRRFYDGVEVVEASGGFLITLDGRPIRTPARAALELPSRALAEAVAEEWQSQGERIDPAAMPLTRLANTAIDRVHGNGAQVVAAIIAYGASDLLCYRTEGPEGLVAREAAAWDPPLAWAARCHGIRLVAVTGVVHRRQSTAALAALARRLETVDDFRLAALHEIATLTGSAVLALAVLDGASSAEAAWNAAHVDEDWQIEQWGRDAEADARRAARRRDFDAAVRLLALA